ncbi:hypothetical protein BO224_02680 [Erysipelotrichaceae bacterium NYU-BL-E8]|uniref:Uncharacterized protein n=1 Tax=Ileibacterium valens TaxID=1862668 RepID=A0A1U7NDH3_9FIRM|nr:hypothetical protein BO222_11035 [Ileibacterium valens]OLU38024.1 hypothetical protein BM735_09815 [Erysipelotrichaceae bacterium NYU-BL-F16]OLU41972.1 hypothetical protein BO224_02680 [Erysipelotrichaceae bacterium NYU-BL-E8]
MNEIKTRNPTAMSAYFGILILRLRISGLFLLGILFFAFWSYGKFFIFDGLPEMKCNLLKFAWA